MSNPLLTLPPKVGNKYLARHNKEGGETYELIIVEADKSDPVCTYRSQVPDDSVPGYWFNPKGKAIASQGVVATLLQDLSEDSEYKKLMAKRGKMMNRLKELGA
jgi:flavin-dependent dehydrogenase